MQYCFHCHFEAFQHAVFHTKFKKCKLCENCISFTSNIIWDSENKKKTPTFQSKSVGLGLNIDSIRKGWKAEFCLTLSADAYPSKV